MCRGWSVRERCCVQASKVSVCMYGDSVTDGRPARPGSRHAHARNEPIVRPISGRAEMRPSLNVTRQITDNAEHDAAGRGQRARCGRGSGGRGTR